MISEDMKTAWDTWTKVHTLGNRTPFEMFAAGYYTRAQEESATEAHAEAVAQAWRGGDTGE